MNTPAPQQFQLRFQSLFDSGRGYAFPCDGQGRVDLDRLSEATLKNAIDPQDGNTLGPDWR